jgi:CRISPR-associated protein Csd2
MKHLDVDVRQDFLVLVDLESGNLNGDPDAGNLPRQDFETGHGFGTDVWFKRMVRDYVIMTRGGQEGLDVYVKHGGYLYDRNQTVHESLGIDPKKGKADDDSLIYDKDDIARAREEMCRRYFDVRSFGAVMNTAKYNCGQVMGPLQIAARVNSVDPIMPQTVSITRVLPTKYEEKKPGKETEMGDKHVVRHAVYVAKGFYNPFLAGSTGFDSEDLALFWEAVQNAPELLRTATKGIITTRGIYVFTHSSKVGDAKAQDLFNLITVEKREGVEHTTRFEDYEVKVDTEKLARDYPGVTLTVL